MNQAPSKFGNGLAGIVALAFSTLVPAPPAQAAEVGILPGMELGLFRIRLDHVNFADPVTPPLRNELIVGDTLLPGNVSGFRLTVSMTVDPTIRIYDFRCPRSYAAQSLITVQTGAMPFSWNGYDTQVMSGVLVWEDGACDLVRAGLWEPGRPIKWTR